MISSSGRLRGFVLPKTRGFSLSQDLPESCLVAYAGVAKGGPFQQSNERRQEDSFSSLDIPLRGYYKTIPLKGYIFHTMAMGSLFQTR